MTTSCLYSLNVTHLLTRNKKEYRCDKTHSVSPFSWSLSQARLIMFLSCEVDDTFYHVRTNETAVIMIAQRLIHSNTEVRV